MQQSKYFKLLPRSILLSLLLSSCSTYYNSVSSIIPKDKNNNALPKNIIMIVADGMGSEYTTAFRYFNDNPDTSVVENTVFDRNFTGLVSTYPAPISGYVTDSAAAATALATGTKTYNDAISVDVNKQPLLTVLEWAKQQGKQTGVVVTTRINHATPAAYLSHNENRRNYDAIANSYIDDGIKADVYFGGGWKNFIRKDRNLVNEFTQAGFQYIDNYQQLATLQPNKAVLGLFADTALPAAIDDTDKYRLTTLTKAAVKQLSSMQSTTKGNKTSTQGYFLLVEASQIDWAGHDNDIAKAMQEMEDLANVVKYLEQYVQSHPDTLVILTADHSTGGLSLGSKFEYRWQPDILRNIPHSIRKISSMMIAQGAPDKAQINTWLNISLTDEEFIQIEEVYKNLVLTKQSDEESVFFAYLKALLTVINERTNTGWTTEGHTGGDVPLFAFGSNSEQFIGQHDNTDIAKKIFTLLGAKSDNSSSK